MSFLKAIRQQIANDLSITIIRADQTGELPALPYATYKVLSDSKGFGHEDISYEEQFDELVEKTIEELKINISFTTYGTTHDQAYELAKKIRKWFRSGGFFFLQELDLSVANISEVLNKTTFLVDSYDEKFGVDVSVLYNDIYTESIDYFNKVEYKVITERE